ncbi:MAG: hypothetical protein ACLTAI_13730 [Thomasclavelia sp.]
MCENEICDICKDRVVIKVLFVYVRRI